MTQDLMPGKMRRSLEENSEDRLELDRRNFLGLLGGSAVSGLTSTTKLDGSPFSPHDVRQAKLLGKFRYSFFFGSQIKVLSSGWAEKLKENALSISVSDTLRVSVYDSDGRKRLLIQTEQFDEICSLPQRESEIDLVEKIIDEADGKYNLFGVLDSIADDDLGEVGTLRALIIGIYAEIAS